MRWGQARGKGKAWAWPFPEFSSTRACKYLLLQMFSLASHFPDFPIEQTEPVVYGGPVQDFSMDRVKCQHIWLPNVTL